MRNHLKITILGSLAMLSLTAGACMVEDDLEGTAEEAALDEAALVEADVDQAALDQAALADLDQVDDVGRHLGAARRHARRHLQAGHRPDRRPR